MLGTVHHECGLTPTLTSSYSDIMRERLRKASEPARKLKVLDVDAGTANRLASGAGLGGVKSRVSNFVVRRLCLSLYVFACAELILLALPSFSSTRAESQAHRRHLWRLSRRPYPSQRATRPPLHPFRASALLVHQSPHRACPTASGLPQGGAGRYCHACTEGTVSGYVDVEGGV